MRRRPLIAPLVVLVVACTPPDGESTPDDAAVPPDATIELDAFVDPPDAVLPDAAPPDALPEPDIWPAPRPPATADPDFVQVGSFNIDWLADHYESEFTPRLAADYAMIARLIVETDVELFGLQEIDGDGALELLGLPDRYAWAVGDSGWSQNPALLYRPDRIVLDDVREVPLPGTDFPSKDPLVAHARTIDGDLEFTIVVVHFKPFSNTEDATYRANQIEQLHRWLTEGLPGAPAPDLPVVIVGDFNDTHDGINRNIRALAPFDEDERLVFVEEDCPGSSQTRYRSRIDHLVIDAALDARLRGPEGEPRCTVERFDERAPYTDYEGGYRGRSNISTHRPLWLYLSVR